MVKIELVIKDGKDGNTTLQVKKNDKNGKENEIITMNAVYNTVCESLKNMYKGEN